MTELEKRIAAKIPGEDTGIEVKQSFCSICAPGFHCGVDAYIKDGKLIKTEGTLAHPQNHGLLCTKGCSNRSFVYREDRIHTPLKRVGERGEGKFEAISWEEAYDLIAEKLLGIREKYGANSVAFFSGYQKWYRFLLERFAYDFGSVNFGTESSCCFTASKMAWMTMTGKMAKADMKNSHLHVAWGGGNHHSRYLNAKAEEELVERGDKLIVVDPRNTPMATRRAALHLRIKPGTDGLLANCIAGIIIKNGWQDMDYIPKYVHGYEAYADYVCGLDVKEVSRITAIPEAQIHQAAEMIATIKPASFECNPTSIIHQSNGYQTVRSIFALCAITGNYDIVGGNQPLTFSFCEMSGGFETLEEEFEQEKTPAGYEDRIGARDYPVWAALVHQMQALSMPDQICTGKPYPIRGMMALGLNHRIFPDSDRFREALGKLDFFVDFDLFLTDTAKMADVVLPTCSSFEREEIKTYPGGFTKYYTPVIEPLYDSRNDARILQDLAKRMKFDDELLCGGYRRCIEHIFQHTGYDIGELAASPLPVKAKGLQPYRPLAYLEQGCKTPSGKLELYSEIIAVNGKEKGLEPLPKWYEPFTRPSKEWPFLLLAGVRIPNAIHTQLHKASWPRALRPDAMADISLADAKRMGIALGDEICLYNQFGSITVKANPTGLVEEGQVYMYHGYAEADVSKLLSLQDTDPYSGFPGYKSASCNIRKVEGNAQ